MNQSLILSLLGHAMLIFMLIVLSIVRPPVPYSKPIVNVRLLDPVTAPKATPAPRRPRTTPKPIAPKVEAPKPPPKPKRKKAVAKKEIVKEKVEIVKAAPTPEPEPTEAPEPTATPFRTPRATPRDTPRPVKKVAKAEPTPVPAVPQDVIPVKPRVEMGQLSTGGALMELGEQYNRMVLLTISRHFRPPYDQPGINCTVGFRIMKDGSIQGVRLARSSGRSELDQAALRAVKDTRQLPALYDEFRKPFMEAEVSFEFSRLR